MKLTEDQLEDSEDIQCDESEEEEEDEISAEDDSEPNIIYAPDKVLSPSAKKRLRCVFQLV